MKGGGAHRRNWPRFASESGWNRERERRRALAPSMPLGTRQTVCVLSETRPKSDAARPRILLGAYSGFSFHPSRSFTFSFKRGLEFPESYRGRRYIPVRENRDVVPPVSLGPRYKRISQQLFPCACKSIIVCIKLLFIIFKRWTPLTAF